MDWLTRWDVALLALAGYVAVMTLVRLMRDRRDELVADVERQMQAHRKRRKKSSSPDGEAGGRDAA